MIDEFKIGDRFFDIGDKNHFTLMREFFGPSNELTWEVVWNNYPSTGWVYTVELRLLKLINNTLVRVKDDKHLMELNLRYG